MKPQEYDQWYDTPRGRWIGETEFCLLNELLAPRQGETLLDVGCGTGWFTRHFAERDGLQVTGLDPNAVWLNYARSRAPQINWLEGDARKLPFNDRRFDNVVSVTALCFVDNWQQALSEMVRVSRRRVVLGLLNRNSLPHLQKGRQGGSGAYRGAHWHTASEVHIALASLPTRNVQVRSAIFLPSGSGFAQTLEQVLPNQLPFGGFLAVSGDVEH
jgi:SAM-dependent methyltransferase